MKIDFQNLEQEKQEIQDFLSRPDAYADPEFAAKSKRGAELTAILELKNQLDADKKALEEAKELLSDPELGELAKDDAANLTEKIEKEEA